MTLILEVVLIVCMLMWFFACLPIPQTAPYDRSSRLLAWICVFILCLLVFGGFGPAGVGRM
jgi:hypothetical protein